VRAVFEHVGIVQIDSVNVLVRSHYLPLFSRLGPYPRVLLEQLVYGRRRELFEYWGHEASLLPLATQPLLRWRMARAKAGLGTWKRIERIAHEHPRLIRDVRKALRDNGPLASSDFEGARGQGSWWGWSDTKTVLEYLFWSGEITTAHRRNFERVYDLTERVLPQEILALPTPSEADAQRELVRIAARAFGVATEADLRDYFRLDLADARARVAELVEGGELLPASVEGWTQAAYLARDARKPRAVAARALLSPFDSLVWERARTQRLFDFRYRIEIYVPAPKRVHGYYVLPFLFGERLVGRVDLKADRAASTLLLQSAHFETHAGNDEREALREELAALGTWLELERVDLKALSRRKR
jgi:uncharacterized protein YcaQ